MTPPIPLQRIPKRPKKPASRAFVLFVAAVSVAVFCTGLIAKCAAPVFPL